LLIDHLKLKIYIVDSINLSLLKSVYTLIGAVSLNTTGFELF